ncbi:MAG: hypothetical protein ACLT2I_02660 [Corynebacterium variabile]
MPKSPVTVTQISDNELVNRIEEAAATALASQSWWARRKNTLTAIAQIILQAANVALFALGNVPLTVTIAVAVVISLAEVIVHAASKAPVTPASAARIAEAANGQSPVVSAQALSSVAAEVKELKAGVPDVAATLKALAKTLPKQPTPANIADAVLAAIRAEERGEHDTAAGTAATATATTDYVYGR